MDTQSTQQKKCPKPPGAWEDPETPIFGVDLIDVNSFGAIIQPGYYMPEAWSMMLYDIMLKASQDKELESQDKNS